MDIKEIEQIRTDFGEEIRSFRINQPVKMSQETLCNKVNAALKTRNSPFGLYQRKISRVERGDPAVILPEKTIQALQQICKLSDKVVKPYLELMKRIPDGQEEYEISAVQIEECGQLLTKPHHSEFKGYIGKYYCYFYSTDSKNPKIVEGTLTIAANDTVSCTAEVVLYEKSHPIKRYVGQFALNRYYQMWYCILVGQERQEVCLLASYHFNSTIKKNLLNMALVLTTSAGMQKRPTMHRMLISRSKLKKDALFLIQSQLMLNTDVITISEESLRCLEQRIADEEQKEADQKISSQYKALKDCVSYIKSNGKKKIYYQIDESIIYDSAAIVDDISLRSFVVATLRNNTDERFYNKISQTVQDICMNIIQDLK